MKLQTKRRLQSLQNTFRPFISLLVVSLRLSKHLQWIGPRHKEKTLGCNLTHLGCALHIMPHLLYNADCVHVCSLNT